MNLYYNDKDDYYIDQKGVCFNFTNYRTTTDKHKFTRDFKEYIAEKNNLNHHALTKSGNVRKIKINYAWEYFKNKQKKLLLVPKNSVISMHK